MISSTQIVFDTTWAIILAGGRGTRFWPRSRKNLPKQCLALTGERTLIQQTIDRILPIIPLERILVVTGCEMVQAIREQIPNLPPDHILVEPQGRNTAAPIAWACRWIAGRGGSHGIVLPSDPAIRNEKEFIRVISATVLACEAEQAITLLGMRPDCPHTGYGYIASGAELCRVDGFSFRSVRRFVEKPTPERALALVEDPSNLWNGGMLVFPVAVLQQAIRTYLPRTAEALDDWEQGALLEEVWEQIDSISMDYGVLEHSPKLLVVPCEIGWSDLGSWTSLDDILPHQEGGVGRVEQLVAVRARGNVVDAPGRVVALLGVDDLVIVDTGDVLLVCSKSQSQRVGELIYELDRKGLSRLT